MEKRLQEEQEKTLLGRVNEVFLLGNFVKVNEEAPILEKKIGVLSDFEKAIFTRRSDTMDEYKVLASFDGIVDERMKYLKFEYKTLNCLLWVSIRTRILEASKYDFFAIYSKWEIVATQKKIEDSKNVYNSIESGFGCI